MRGLVGAVAVALALVKAAPVVVNKAEYVVTVPGVGTVRGVTSNSSEAVAFFGGTTAFSFHALHFLQNAHTLAFMHSSLATLCTKGPHTPHCAPSTTVHSCSLRSFHRHWCCAGCGARSFWGIPRHADNHPTSSMPQHPLHHGLVCSAKCDNANPTIVIKCLSHHFSWPRADAPVAHAHNDSHHITSLPRPSTSATDRHPVWQAAGGGPAVEVTAPIRTVGGSPRRRVRRWPLTAAVVGHWVLLAPAFGYSCSWCC
jgi:hypothetical protein